MNEETLYAFSIPVLMLMIDNIDHHIKEFERDDADTSELKKDRDALQRILNEKNEVQ